MKTFHSGWLVLIRPEVAGFEVTGDSCWAHARRRFFEAQQEHPRMAKAALRLIGRMYLRERVWDEQQLSPAER